MDITTAVAERERDRLIMQELTHAIQILVLTVNIICYGVDSRTGTCNEDNVRSR